MDNDTAKPRRIKRQMLGRDLWWVKALDYVGIGVIIYAVVTFQWFLIFFALLLLGINHLAKDAGVTTDGPGAESFYIFEDEEPSPPDGESGANSRSKDGN